MSDSEPLTACRLPVMVWTHPRGAADKDCLPKLVGGALGSQTTNDAGMCGMSESDREKCFTCGLWWGGRGSHPPCLKLTPEERRELGAYAVTGRIVEPPEETTYGDYQAARKA